LIHHHKNPIARDPTSGIETHHVDNRFIPVRVGHLVSVLIEQASGRLKRRECREFVAALQAVIEQEAAAFERDVMDLYVAFSPDRETIPGAGDAAARTPEGYALLHARLAYLLDKANFARLDDVQIDRALEVASSQGLTVRLDPSRIEELSLWVRGRGQIERVRRSWRHPIRGVNVWLPVFHRLVVVGRLTDDPHVLLKMFKDIPEEDVEALLPHAEVSMSWLDRCFMLSGSAGALGPAALKVVAGGLAALTTAVWTLTIGLGLFVWRTFHGYRRTRLRRDSQRTRHLYYQNLSNNAGTIYTLSSLIAQEEMKEAVLAYFLCATAVLPIRHEADLCERARVLLREQFGVDVDFDAPDAVETLDHLNLWSDRAGFHVLPLEQAAGRLSAHWIDRRSESYHRHMSSEHGDDLLTARAVNRLDLPNRM
jgi:hypothetical protein